MPLSFLLHYTKLLFILVSHNMGKLFCINSFCKIISYLLVYYLKLFHLYHVFLPISYRGTLKVPPCSFMYQSGFLMVSLARTNCIYKIGTVIHFLTQRAVRIFLSHIISNFQVLIFITNNCLLV